MNTDILGEPRFEMGNIRRKETNLPLNEARRDILNALQAALDHCGTGTLLSAQLNNAIQKAKNL
jgi:hypothetical protein